VERFKQKFHIEKKIAYAGRLDPLAEGLLLLLIEPETKKANKYWGLDKVYEVAAISGFSTDSHDLLGHVVKCFGKKPNLKADEIKTILENKTGKIMQKYPAYSSKAVRGKPLFLWAREEKLDKIDIPKKNIEIYSIDEIDVFENDKKAVEKEIFKKIDLVKGDFRQKLVKDGWKKCLAMYKDKKCVFFKFRIYCSSGTYVRQLVHETGENTGYGSCAYVIKRVQIGKYNKPTLKA
jgi:tRNA pseudouridine55 synthase